MNKLYRAFPEFCERCDGKITNHSGWGVLMLCAVQPQPNTPGKGGRSIDLHLCGYCMKALARWFRPDEEVA